MRYQSSLGAIGGRWVLGVCALLGCALPVRPVVTVTPAVTATPVMTATPAAPPPRSTCSRSPWQRVTPPAPPVERQRSVALSDGATLWINYRLDRVERDGTTREVCAELGGRAELAVVGDTILGWPHCGGPGWGLWRSTDGGRHCERAGDGFAPRLARDTRPCLEQYGDRLRIAASSRVAAAWACHEGEGELWLSTDAGRSWAEGPRPHCPVDSMVATESGELVAFARRSRETDARRLASPDARAWDLVTITPPLRGNVTGGATADGAVYAADQIGITRLPPHGGTPERRVVGQMEGLAEQAPDLFAGSWVGEGRFVGWIDFNRIGPIEEPFMELTMDGLRPWASAPRAFPRMNFYPDGRGGLYGIGSGPQLHQTPDGVWRDLRGSLLGTEPIGAVAARDPLLAVAGAFGKVAWSLDNGAHWASTQLPEAAGQPYRMTIDEEGRLLVLGTGALVRLSVPSGQVETIPLPVGWPLDRGGWWRGLINNPELLLAAHRGGILLLRGALWERGVDGVWRKRFGCTDPRSPTQCPEHRYAITATVDDGGVWLLDGESALWRRRDGDRTFARVSDSMPSRPEAIGVAPDGSIALASAYRLVLARAGSHSFEDIELAREHEPPEGCIGRIESFGGVIATAEGLLLVRPDPMRSESFAPAPPHAPVSEVGGGLRATEMTIAAWARDGDVLYAGSGSDLWRASMRALLQPPPEGYCDAE